MGMIQQGVLALLVAAAGPATSFASEQAGGEDLFEHVTNKARTVAGESFSPPGGDLPEALAGLSYQQYRDIRFRKDHALWKDESLFSIELFHLGFLYHEPVTVHEVVDGDAAPVEYDPAMFDLGKNADLQDQLGPDLGYAGFRVHYPINRDGYRDEVIAFLGASYFRMVGSGQSYGLSARGLAVDTALPTGEEFPRFTELWLVRPGPDATSMTFYALLDSESVSGAYRFELTPGADTVLDVEARLFARRDIDKLGVAPLTSMFMFGENTVQHYDDFRPEVHDSDGLLVHTGDDEWIWRPLTHGRTLQVSTLLDRGPHGFGLVQRDRDFENYLDTESHYHSRPSHWISPQGGDWGEGAVELVEIPSREETNDNIVAYWVPERRLEAGQERRFRYRLRTFGSKLDVQQLATVERTRIGWSAIPGSDEKPPRSSRQFIVDFSGGELANLDASQPVQAELTAANGDIEDVITMRLPADHKWRVAFKLNPEQEKPVDMRLFLKLRGRRLSETWNYVWRPELIE